MLQSRSIYIIRNQTFAIKKTTPFLLTGYAVDMKITFYYDGFIKFHSKARYKAGDKIEDR